MTASATCRGRVFASQGDLTGFPCGKRAAFEEDGIPYCAEHKPSKRREREDRARRPAWAMAACRELIEGDGTAEGIQRAIDLARVALGKDPMPDGMIGHSSIEHARSKKRETT